MDSSIGTLRDSIAAPILESMGNSSSLANHLLIAMPSLGDHFSQTVALVCEHSDRGALGIVLNKPLGMKLGDVMAQMKLETSDIGISEQPVLRGGPVHTDRGFVLHRPGGDWDSTHRISDHVQVTTSDRKSTRLNSSHLGISYAVFCLK